MVTAEAVAVVMAVNRANGTLADALFQAVSRSANGLFISTEMK